MSQRCFWCTSHFRRVTRGGAYFGDDRKLKATRRVFGLGGNRLKNEGPDFWVWKFYNVGFEAGFQAIEKVRKIMFDYDLAMMVYCEEAERLRASFIK